MGDRVQVEILGLRELTRALARIDPELGKELGQRNKAIGARIIAAIQPTPVTSGAGYGAMPRPSASRNLLKITAGSSRRTHPPVQQWGPRYVPRSYARGFIWGAAEKQIGPAQADFTNAVIEVARKAGLEAY